jgi:short-subunit dehydrogenase
VKLRGSVVLVTGASSGIGAETARALASAGATVGLVARREERLAAVLDECRESAPESRYWVADLAEPETASRVALEAWDAFGHLDGVVNNAGIPKRRHVTQLGFDEVEQVMRVNYLSPVRLMLAVLPRMLERGSGTIVNVASMAGRVGTPRETAYSASKFAINGFTEAMAIDLAGSPVQVRVVQPGPIETEIWDLPDNDAPRYHGPKWPATDVAAAILAALSGEAGFEQFVPPDLKAVADFKAANIDTFLEGAASFDASGGEIPDVENAPDFDLG